MAEDIYRELINSIDEGFCVIDLIFDDAVKPVDFRYIGMNPLFSDCVGRSDVTGQLVSELFPGTEPFWFEFYGKVAVSGKSSRIVNEHKMTGKWFEVFAFKIGGSESRKVGVLVRDITERKRAEKKLREQSQLLSHVSDAVITTDTDFHIRSWNKAAESIYGWTEAEVVGQNADELLATEFINTSFAEAAERLFNTGSVQTENIHTTRNGRRILVHGKTSLIKDSDGNITGTLAILRDVTERKQADDALRESEERQAFLLKLSDELSPLADPSDIHEAVTRAAMDFLGSDRCYYCEIVDDNAIIRRDASRGGLPSVAGVYPLSALPIHKSLIDAGKPFSVSDVQTTDMVDETLRQLCIQLQVISYLDVPVVKGGKPVGILCVVQSTPRTWNDADAILAVEIAERTWAAVERANVEQTLAFQARLLSDVHDAIVATDANDRVTYWNGIAEEVFGWKAEEVIGKPSADIFQTIVPDSSREEAIGKLMKSDYYQGTVIYHHKNGQAVYTNVHANVSRDRNGDFQGIVSSFRDITEHKRAEEALRESEERYRTLFESMDEGFGIAEMLFNEHGVPADYVILEVNRAYETQSGLRPEVVIGKRATEYLDNVEPAWFERYGRVVTSNESIRFEEYNAALDRWFNVHAFPLPKKNRFGMIFTNITDRKRVEDALRKSEERFRLAQEISPDGFTILQPVRDENGSVADFIFVYQNDSIARIGGTDPRLVIGKRLLELFPNHKGTPIFEAYCHVASTGESRILEESSYIGETIPIRTWFRLVVVSMGKDIAILAQDITERKHADTALRESEERQVFLLKLSDVLRPLSDARTIQAAATDLLTKHLEVMESSFSEHTKDTIVIKSETLNDGTQNLSVAGVHNKSDLSGCGAILRAGNDLVIEDVLSFSGYSEAERASLTALKIRASISIPLLKEGNLVAVLTVRQSTPRKWKQEEVELVRETVERTWAAMMRVRAEEALRESEALRTSAIETERQRLYDVLETLPVLVCLISPDYHIVFANRTFRDKFGESGGRHCYEYCCGYDQPCPNCESLVPLKTGQAHHWGFIHPNRFTVIDAYDFPFTDMDGSPLILEMGVDITERRQAEKAMREGEKKALALVSQLEKADKNKNQFISVLSHELRNPLAVIVASLSLLEISSSLEQVSMSKEIINREVSQLTKLVDDLLDLTRINQNKIRLKKENIDLNEVLKNVSLDVKPQYMAKNIRLNVKLPKSPVIMSADPVRTAQVVGNLLHNSLKYTQTTGKVAMSLEVENSEAVIRVRDNGIGIGPDLLEHLFEPFTQADTSLDRPNGGGLGLGLSIVKGIVELYGGTVTAFSKGVRKGSMVTVRLPISVQPDETRNGVSVKTGRHYRILLIDDNKALTEVLCTMLGMKGHQVSAAYSGPIGIAEAKKIRPDVIFCDIGLPGLDGFKVANTLKTDPELKKTYLIALTGYAGDFDIERAQLAGFDRDLVKPVDMAVLDKVLAEIDG